MQVRNEWTKALRKQPLSIVCLANFFGGGRHVEATWALLARAWWHDATRREGRRIQSHVQGVTINYGVNKYEWVYCVVGSPHIVGSAHNVQKDQSPSLPILLSKSRSSSSSCHSPARGLYELQEQIWACRVQRIDASLVWTSSNGEKNAVTVLFCIHVTSSSH